MAVRLIARFAHRIAALAHDALGNAFAHGVAALLIAGLVARFAGCTGHLLVAGLIARPITGLALLTVAGLANLLHNGFLHRLIAGLPALFQDGVVNQFVAGLALLLTSGEAALGLATRLLTTAVVGAAAMRCRRELNRPQQADQCSQQRRSQAHPHDNRLLIDTLLCGIPGEKINCPSLRSLAVAARRAPAVRQRRTAFRVWLSARHSAWNKMLKQFTALTPPSSLPPATSLAAVPMGADARPRKKTPATWFHVAGRGWIAGIGSR